MCLFEVRGFSLPQASRFMVENARIFDSNDNVKNIIGGLA